jgi:hypothetical protein
MENLNSFRFNKDSGKILFQKTMKLPVSREYPLSKTTKVEVIKNIIDDPLSISSANVAFTQASEENLRNMACDIEEKDERIRSLEEEVHCYKSDHENIMEFRECAKEVRK